MSEQVKPRTSASIQEEYANLAFKAGNLQYEIVERNSNLVMVNNTLRELSLEYTRVKEAEDKTAAPKKDADAGVTTGDLK